MTPFTNPLKKGSNGNEVLSLQNRLIEIGFKKCFIDGKIKELKSDGDFGEVTESCLESFQAKVLDAILTINVPNEIKNQYTFEVDGVMDFADWYILENFEQLSQFYNTNIIDIEIPESIESSTNSEKMIKEVVELAKQEIGTVESGGANSGVRVNEYQKIGSDGEINTGAPWCQFFMNWLLIKSSEKLQLPYKWIYSGYTPECVNYGIEKNIGIKGVKWEDIKIGDFGFVYSAARKNARHVFLIVDKNEDKKTVTTIEGNTNNDGSAEGYGVFKRVRNFSQVWATVSWSELYD